MPFATAARLAALALLAPALSACVSASSNPSSARASALADIVSRAAACNAGYASRNTLERFLDAERARCATDEQIASARSTYVTVSEARTINQGVRPEPCTAQERATLRGQMNTVRAGRFETL
jgi:hypothetical protein